MRTKLLTLAACVPLILFTGCNKNTHESVYEDQIDVLEDMVALMKSVKDDASAKAASAKMKDLEARANEIEKRAKALGEPPAELKKKYEPKLEELAGQLLAENMRIALNPELNKHLGSMK